MSTTFQAHRGHAGPSQRLQGRTRAPPRSDRRRADEEQRATKRSQREDRPTPKESLDEPDRGREAPRHCRGRACFGCNSEPRKPWAAPAQKVEPVDYIFRAFTAKLVSHVHNTPLIDTMKSLYGEDVTTKAVMDAVVVLHSTRRRLLLLTRRNDGLGRRARSDRHRRLLRPAAPAVGLSGSVGRRTLHVRPQRHDQPSDPLGNADGCRLVRW
jgi:hypothetical protein